MSELQTTGGKGVIGIAVVIAAVMLLAAAFVGWMHYGSAILLTLASQGLSWCL